MEKKEGLYNLDEILADEFDSRPDVLAKIKSTGVKITGGDGKSLESALKISGKISKELGAVLIQLVINRLEFRHRKIDNSLIMNQGKWFLEFRFMNSERKEVFYYFDITDFF